MARITLNICDWCKQDIKSPGHKDEGSKGLVVLSGKAKTRKYEICQACSDNICNQLNASVTYTPPAAVQVVNRSSGTGEIVPSAGKTPIVSKKAPPRQCSTCDGSGFIESHHNGDIRDCTECKRAKCTHDRKSFDEKKTVCKDCGLVLPIL